MNRLPFFILLALATTVGLCAADAVAPGGLTVGTGFDYSRGKYGLATSTEYLAVPLTLSYEEGPWTVDARIPWVRLQGPATVVAGGGSPTRPTSAAESGLGDIFLSSTYRFGVVAGSLNLAATGRVKLPTASDERGLGTGSADYYFQLDAYETFGAATPFISVGYAALGNGPTYTLEDGPYVTAGSHFRTSDQTVLTAAFNWRHRLVAGGDHGAEAMLALNHDLNPHWHLMVYALAGFTDASPDSGGGVQLGYRF